MGFDDIVQIFDPENIKEEPEKQDQPTEDSVNDVEPDASEDQPVAQQPEDQPEDQDTSSTDTADDDKGIVAATEHKDVIKVVAEHLASRGLVKLPEDFSGSLDEFESILDNLNAELPKIGAQIIWENLPEQARDVLAYALKGGTDLNNYFRYRYMEADLEKLDPLSPNDAEEILYRYYKETTGYDHDKIIRLIERLKKAGDLSEEADSALAELKDIMLDRMNKELEQKAKAEEEQMKKMQEYQSAISQTVHTVIKDPNEASAVQGYILNTSTDSKGNTTTRFARTMENISSNPEHLVTLAYIVYKYYDDKKGFDLDKLVKIAESNVTGKLKQKLADVTSNKRNSATEKPASKPANEDLAEFLKHIM